MTIGPAAAIVLAAVPSFSFIGLDVVEFTMASWCMLAIWIGYFFIFMRFFTDPLEKHKDHKLLDADET
jgi:hypothetical protein